MNNEFPTKKEIEELIEQIKKLNNQKVVDETIKALQLLKTRD